MINLPAAFTERMKQMLGREYDAFIASYDKERSQGLRVNGLKTDPAEFAKTAPFSLNPVAWAAEGFAYGAGDRPGRQPYHDAGVYYIQEPSAMIAASLLNPQPGEMILDLCAAPGGKSTQAAARLGGEGLLVSNEIHPARAKILSQNIERMGIRNAVVTNEDSGRRSIFRHFLMGSSWMHRVPARECSARMRRRSRNGARRMCVAVLGGSRRFLKMRR